MYALYLLVEEGKWIGFGTWWSKTLLTSREFLVGGIPLQS